MIQLLLEMAINYEASFNEDRLKIKNLIEENLNRLKKRGNREKKIVRKLRIFLLLSVDINFASYRKHSLDF